MTLDEAQAEAPRVEISSRPRAGFWRRVLALLADMAIVLIPLQLIVAILFSATNGAVQGAFGFATSACYVVEQIPDGLEPPPPEGFNQIVDCRSWVSILGLETARTLTVSRVTQEGTQTSAISLSYSLDAHGKPIKDAVDAGWLAEVALLAYLVLLEFRWGRTLGKRLTAIRTVDTASPDRIGLPFGKAFLRQVAMWIGVMPALALQFLWLGGVSTESELESIANNQLFWLGSIFGVVVALIWAVWIIVSLVRKVDPVYDRLAGTAVLRI